MILVGRTVSPFVRRTAVVLKLLGRDYEELQLSTADDLEAILEKNPVGRVPALILDDGETIVDSQAIIEHLLEEAGPANGLMPPSGAARRRVRNLSAIATGAMEKGVSSSYERNRRPEDKIYQGWVERVDGQSASALAALEAAAAGGEWLADDAMTLADIDAAIAYQFIKASAPYQMEGGGYPSLADLVARMKDIPAYAESRWRG